MSTVLDSPTTSATRLVIPSFDVASGDVHLFKTPHHPRFKRDYRWKAKDVAMATSAAPTYFSIFHHEQSGLRLVDGGVWANNPVAIGMSEAIGVLGCSPSRIEVLSVGTTASPFHVKLKKRRAGVLGSGRGLIRLLLEAQTVGMTGLTHSITEHDQRLLRIDSVVQWKRFKMDDSKQIQELCPLGERVARHNERLVNERFLEEGHPATAPHVTHRVEIDPFQPFSVVRAESLKVLDKRSGRPGQYF